MRTRLRRSRLSTQHETHQGHPFDCPSWPSAAVPSEPSSCVRNIVNSAIPGAIPPRDTLTCAGGQSTRSSLLARHGLSPPAEGKRASRFERA
eukprot:scaffold55202_cov35-Phaeocystis_antarctica.AAC.1